MSSVWDTVRTNVSQHIITPFTSLPVWQQCCIAGGVGIVTTFSFGVLTLQYMSDKVALDFKYQNSSNDIPELTAKEIVKCNNLLGECPIWDDKKQLLCWLDTAKGIFWTCLLYTSPSPRDRG